MGSALTHAMVMSMGWYWPPAQAVSVPQLRPSGHAHSRQDHAGHQATADHLVPGLLSDWPDQDWHLKAQAVARQLQARHIGLVAVL